GRPNRGAVVYAVEGVQVDRGDAASGEAAGLRPGVRQQGQIGRGDPGGRYRFVHRYEDLPGNGGTPGEGDVLELAGEERPGGRACAEEGAAGRGVGEVEVDRHAGAGLEAAAVADSRRDPRGGAATDGIDGDPRDRQVRSRERVHALDGDLRAQPVLHLPA